MAVIKAKPEVFMPFLFQLAEREMVLPLLTTRVAESNFIGARGDTVTMRVGGGFRTRARKYDFRSRTSPIVLDDISEDSNAIAITLDTHTYSATGITDEQATLDDLDWTREIIQPQAEAVAADLEIDVLTAFNGLRYKHNLTFADGDDPYLFLVEANRLMNLEKVIPSGGRTWLMGTNVAASVLKSDRITRFDSAGASNTTALREATIGNLAGTNIVVSQAVDPDWSVINHKSTLVLGSVAPRVPRGASAGARVTNSGFAFRWIADYDSNFLQDRSIVSAFSGITPVYDERVGGNGPDRYDLKPLEDGELPVSVRSVGVQFQGPSGSFVEDTPGETPAA